VNPDGYADVVQFGAHEDHDLYPGPGNVIGDVRSAEASTGEGTGLSTFVMTVKEWTGSTPNPEGCKFSATAVARHDASAGTMSR
jgi:hypothetical protein